MPPQSIINSLYPLFANCHDSVSYKKALEAYSQLIEGVESEVEELEKKLGNSKVRLEGLKETVHFLVDCTKKNESWELKQRSLSSNVRSKCFQISNDTNEKMQD